MAVPFDRRHFLQLAGLGGVVYASGLGLSACATPGAAATPDFFFVQLSDTHWGYAGAANPDARGTLPRAIAAINALPVDPDFIVFTGDLTHLTLDAGERRARLEQFREQVAALRVRNLRFLPGEHDASADRGAVYTDIFGPTHYAFDHKGIHFVALDNVSDPSGSVGAAQLAWLEQDLAARPANSPIMVLTHRPLFDLQPQWGWTTRDGTQVLEVLQRYPHVTVFYGHIHQEHHHQTGAIAHHSAQSLIFPLPAPGPGTEHLPLPWDAQHAYRGLSWRDVQLQPASLAKGQEGGVQIHPHPLA